MDELRDQADCRNKIRRKLIRGSFSAPAVLAVHNGSALAASSNNKRCAINSIASDPTTPPQPIAGSGGDGFSRANYYNDAASPTPALWVKKSELDTLAAGAGVGINSPSGTNTGYIQVITGGAYAYGTPTGSVGATPTGSVALLFQDSGGSISIIGFVQPGTATFATNTGVVTGSCWSSLKP